MIETQETWIRLYRKIQDWEWYQDSAMVHLFIHLMMKAHHAETRYKGQKIKRGQLMTGFRKLSEETGISVQKIRTCIKRLKSTHELTHQSTHHGTIITLCNYSTYNPLKGDSNTPINTPINTQLTHDQHNNKNYKNDKKDIPLTTFEEYKADFESWWTRYKTVANRRAGHKTKSGEAYTRLRKKFSTEEIDLATRHYIQECQRDQTSTKDAERFLRPDLITQYQEPPNQVAQPGQFSAEEHGWKPASEHYGPETDLLKEYEESLKMEGQPYAN